MGNQNYCKDYCKGDQNDIINESKQITIQFNQQPKKIPNQKYQNIKKELFNQQQIQLPDILKTYVSSFIRKKQQFNIIQAKNWIQLSNGNYYKGQIKQSKPATSGIFIINKSKTYYMGNFNVNMQPEGQGFILFSNGNYFQGNFLSGKSAGIGFFKNQNYTITGIWKNGQILSGKIKALTYQYEGQFQNQKFHGKGFFRKGHHYYYQGLFKNGQYNGIGIQGNQYYVYHGQWIQGKKNGQGIIQYTDRSNYKGFWKQNKKHGNGIYTSKTGKKWEGIWEQGNRVKGNWL